MVFLEVTTALGTTTSLGTTTEQSEATTDNVCYCTCPVSKWLYLSTLNLTTDELRIIMKDDLEQLQSILYVDKKETSAYYRSIRSANDERLTAMSAGYVGVVMLCTPIVLFVAIDLTRCFH